MLAPHAGMGARAPPGHGGEWAANGALFCGRAWRRGVSLSTDKLCCGECAKPASTSRINRMGSESERGWSRAKATPRPARQDDRYGNCKGEALQIGAGPHVAGMRESIG